MSDNGLQRLGTESVHYIIPAALGASGVVVQSDVVIAAAVGVWAVLVFGVIRGRDRRHRDVPGVSE